LYNARSIFYFIFKVEKLKAVAKNMFKIYYIKNRYTNGPNR